MTRYAEDSELQARIDKQVDDTVLNLLLDASSQLIDRVCRRPDGFVALATATAKYYMGNGSPVQEIHECVAVTEVAVKDSPTDDTYTVWETDKYILARGDPENPTFATTPYTLILVGPNEYDVFTSGRFSGRGGFRPRSRQSYGVPTVKITAKWGYAVEVPDLIKEAAILQASRWYSRGRSGWADTLASAEFGIQQFRRVMDPDLEMMLSKGHFIRPAIGRGR